MLYLSISLYLLPSIAVILKIRKRKLQQSGVSSESSSLQIQSMPIDELTVACLNNFATKLVSNNANLTAINTSDLQFQAKSISLNIENCRELNYKLLNQAQLSVLLYV